MKVSDNDASLRAANHNGLKTLLRIAAVLLLSAFVSVSWRCQAAEEDGVALAIIYDTSGSMRELVPDIAGHKSPKYVVANRALISIAQQVQAFATKKDGPPRKIEAGLFTFENSGGKESIKFGPFNENAFENFARTFSSPTGNTPLGNTLAEAGEVVLNSKQPHKHVLVITDGVNTAGASPASVMTKLKKQAEEKQASLSIHFVAFDVDAKEFEPLKKRGATVVGAANETQLNSQLQYILQRKILLEEEEPPQKKN